MILTLNSLLFIAFLSISITSIIFVKCDEIPGNPESLDNIDTSSSSNNNDGKSMDISPSGEGQYLPPPLSPPVLSLPFFYAPPFGQPKQFRLRSLFLPAGHFGDMSMSRSLFPIRPGRAESNFIRFGRSSGGVGIPGHPGGYEFKKNNFIRLGRENPRQTNFIRLGRNLILGYGDGSKELSDGKLEKVGFFPNSPENAITRNGNGYGKAAYVTGTPLWGKDYQDI